MKKEEKWMREWSVGADHCMRESKTARDDRLGTEVTAELET